MEMILLHLGLQSPDGPWAFWLQKIGTPNTSASVTPLQSSKIRNPCSCPPRANTGKNSSAQLHHPLVAPSFMPPLWEFTNCTLTANALATNSLPRAGPIIGNGPITVHTM